MSQELKQIKIAKCTEEELDNIRTYLQDLEEVLEENSCYDSDDSDINKEIADVARKLPERSFIIPLNLGILLDNYQDKDSDIIEHPKWIMEIFGMLEEINKFLNDNPNDSIKKNSDIHNRIKLLLNE